MALKSLDTKLDTDTSAPLYKLVEKRILQCLAEGEWKPGGQLPPESALAERFGVAVFTIRGGIKELVAANILLRRQGKGTFVARHTRQRQRYQFSHVFAADGTQIFPDRTLVSFKRENARDDLKKILRMHDKARAPVFRIECLLSVGALTAATLQIALPAGIFSSLTPRAIRDSTENLYAVYQNACGVNIIRIEEQVHSAIAGQHIGGALGIRPQCPVLRIERIAYTYNDVPVEFRVRHLDGTKFHYRLSEGGF